MLSAQSIQSALEQMFSTKSGQELLNQKAITLGHTRDARKYINALSSTIAKYANTYIHNLSASDLLNVISETTDKSTGKTILILRFNHSQTHRESLYPEGYPNGLDNIVALYNDGYNARSSVYGFINGNRVRSPKSMAGTNIIQHAIDSFNKTYMKDNVMAKLQR